MLENQVHYLDGCSSRHDRGVFKKLSLDRCDVLNEWLLSWKEFECPVAKGVRYRVLAGIHTDFTFTSKASDEDDGDLA
ncbi:hypothetical protein E2542_SST31421 [Spatholobus suberectus]|nr:hypothetical protein E2542_SST31421 [Spatholobus suberectus]